MVYVFINREEARALRRQWNPATIKRIQGELHSLVNVRRDDLERLQAISGRRKGLRVQHKGKHYRAFATKHPPRVGPKNWDHLTPVNVEDAIHNAGSRNERQQILNHARNKGWAFLPTLERQVKIYDDFENYTRDAIKYLRKLPKAQNQEQQLILNTIIDTLLFKWHGRRELNVVEGGLIRTVRRLYLEKSKPDVGDPFKGKMKTGKR